MSGNIIKFPKSYSIVPLFSSNTDTQISQILIDYDGKVIVFKSKEELKRKSIKYLIFFTFEKNRLSTLSLNKLSYYDEKSNRLIYYPIIKLNNNFINNFCYLNIIERPKKISNLDWEATLKALFFYKEKCYESGKLVKN